MKQDEPYLADARIEYRGGINVAEHDYVAARTPVRPAPKLPAEWSDTVDDRDLLEAILSRCITSTESRTLAPRLLSAFGDFGRVLRASESDLKRVRGVTDAVICELKLTEASGYRMARCTVVGRDAISSWDSLLHYCQTRMAYASKEEFRVLFLDRKNILIADEKLASGTTDFVPVFPREIVKRALELNASSMILVHNHPSGDCSPSEQDVVMTQQIVQAALALDLTVHDHLIIGTGEPFSFRAMNLI